MANTTSKKSAKVAKSPRPAPPKPGVAAKPTLLAGGNPQIAKADGDAPVQAYIAAMPAGNATSGTASTRSSCAPSPTCARQSSGTRPSTASRARAGSSTSMLHELRQSRFLPRHVTASSPPRRVQAEGSALPRHPRGRPARPGADGDVDPAGGRPARLGPMTPANDNNQSDNNHEESHNNQLSLSADRPENQGADRLAGRDARSRKKRSSNRPTPKWSRSGSGEGVPVWSHAGMICTVERTRTA